jgi:hypothetical protein
MAALIPVNDRLIKQHAFKRAALLTQRSKLLRKIGIPQGATEMVEN